MVPPTEYVFHESSVLHDSVFYVKSRFFFTIIAMYSLRKNDVLSQTQNTHQQRACAYTAHEGTRREQMLVEGEGVIIPLFTIHCRDIYKHKLQLTQCVGGDCAWPVQERQCGVWEKGSDAKRARVEGFHGGTRSSHASHMNGSEGCCPCFTPSSRKSHLPTHPSHMYSPKALSGQHQLCHIGPILCPFCCILQMIHERLKYSVGGIIRYDVLPVSNNHRLWSSDPFHFADRPMQTNAPNAINSLAFIKPPFHIHLQFIGTTFLAILYPLIGGV
jgi:hypothetical protein